jgi:hypothetical protein
MSILARRVKVILRSTILNFPDFLIAIGFPLGRSILTNELGHLKDHYVDPGTDLRLLEDAAKIAPFVSLNPRLIELRGDTVGYTPDARLITLLYRMRQTQCTA